MKKHKDNCNCGICDAMRGINHGFKKGDTSWNNNLTKEMDSRVARMGNRITDREGEKNPNWKNFAKEIRICAFPDCNITFECNLDCTQKYHCFECYWKSLIGKNHSEEHNKKISKSMLGKNKGKYFNLELAAEVNAILSGEKEAPFCACDCGERIEIKEYHTYYGIPGYILGHSTKGENNPMWLGGIGSAPYAFEFNEAFKTFIRERDNDTCQLCGKTKEQEGQNLCVHHIHYDKMNDCRNELDFITLCNGCNIKVNYNREHQTHFFNKKIEELKVNSISYGII